MEKFLAIYRCRLGFFAILVDPPEQTIKIKNKPKMMTCMFLALEILFNPELSGRIDFNISAIHPIIISKIPIVVSIA